MYRILEYPKIMRKQYSIFHFLSSYTRRSSKKPQSICPYFPGIVSTPHRRFLIQVHLSSAYVRLDNNVVCKEAPEKAINDNYSDNRLNTAAIYQDVVGKFGVERVKFVLATTIQHKDWDERFSRNNRAWAQTVPMEASFGSRENDHSVYYVVDRAHSSLTDLFVSHFRREQAREHEQPKRESILGKLQKPLPEPAAKAGKDKSHER